MEMKRASPPIVAIVCCLFFAALAWGQPITPGVNANIWQKRVSSSCASGSSIRAISSLGNVTCETDDGLTGSISDGSLPKGSSGNLTNSAVSDDGTNVEIAKQSSVARLNVGDEASSASAGLNGLKLMTFSDGSNYIDSKVTSGGSTVFRCGHNTETGMARTWMTLTNSSGDVATTGKWTLGDANTDTLTVYGHDKHEGTAPGTSVGCDGSGTATTVGTDGAFHTTTGSGATACTWTFSRTYTVVPACTVFAEAGIGNPTCTISATAITCTVVTAGTYHWRCASLTGGT